jgi:hypothetical protein
MVGEAQIRGQHSIIPASGRSVIPSADGDGLEQRN